MDKPDIADHLEYPISLEGINPDENNSLSKTDEIRYYIYKSLCYATLTDFTFF